MQDPFSELMQFNLGVPAEKSKEIYVEDVRNFLIQQQIFNGAMKEIRTKLEILDEEFRVLFDHNPIHHLEYRLKSPRSIIEKLRRYDLPLTLDSIKDNLYDVAGIRVICHYVEDIYLLRKLLLQQDDLNLVRERDYIAEPKANGYRSLHLIVEVPVYLSEKTTKMSVEIQLRTVAMDFWASLEHEINYKSSGDIPDEIRYRLKLCAEDIYRNEEEMQRIHREVMENYLERKTSEAGK
ncbi:MAG: GTP pyrophosphokinase family protein [Tissierellia bacterium]|nr:GTP pyrophosphokinase family protein [Tissierellia bacterium]